MAELSVFNICLLNCFFISCEIQFYDAKIIQCWSPPYFDLKALSPIKYVFFAFGLKFSKTFYIISYFF